MKLSFNSVLLVFAVGALAQTGTVLFAGER